MTVITSGLSKVGEIIKGLFAKDGKEVQVVPAASKDEVQKDARNVPDETIKKIWSPKTSIEDGIEKVYNDMKPHYG